MNTRQLTYVLSIAETGNLSAAAKELGVSQPALSKYLAELEDELGTELFLRYKKQLYPTAAGKIYLEAATRIIGVKEQTYQIISELSNGYQKTLHIGVTPLRGSIAIAQIFNQFHRQLPQCKNRDERTLYGRTAPRHPGPQRANWHLAPATTRTNPISSILLSMKKNWFFSFLPSILLPTRQARTSIT
mgnify:CR=1 FL=1